MKPSVDQIVDFVFGYQARFGWAPSRREIGEHFGIGMMLTQQLLADAERDGMIELGARARQVKVMKHPQRRRDQM